MEQRCSELQQRKNQLAQRSDVGNSKATACFSYIPTMLTHALPGAQWIRDMGTWQQALAQQCNPTPAVLLIVFNSSKGSIFLEYFRLPVPLTVGRL